MKVGICYTKDSPSALKIFEAFHDSVLAVGDTPICMFNASHLRKCDVFFQVCDYNKHEGLPNFRHALKKFAAKYSIPRLIVDTGFMKNGRKTNSLDGYFAVGLRGIKNDAQYFNEDSPPDRFEQLELEVPVLNIDTTKNYILIYGQQEIGVSTQDMNILKWWEDIIVDIKQRWPHKDIIFRKHLNQKKMPRGNYMEVDSVEEYIEDCLFSVACTTNACVESFLAGIPCYTDNERSIGYHVRLEQIPNPRDVSIFYNPFFKRIESYNNLKQWFYNLSYAQWTIDEIRQGLCWTHFRKHLC